MTEKDFPSPERYEQVTLAELKLALAESYDDLHRLWREETCPRMRQEFAAMYRDIIGIDPALRDPFLEAMHDIRAGSDLAVQTAIDMLTQPKSSPLPEG